MLDSCCVRCIEFFQPQLEMVTIVKVVSTSANLD